MEISLKKRKRIIKKQISLTCICMLSSNSYVIYFWGDELQYFIPPADLLNSVPVDYMHPDLFVVQFEQSEKSFLFEIHG